MVCFLFSVEVKDKLSGIDFTNRVQNPSDVPQCRAMAGALSASLQARLWRTYEGT
jgi:hypothetical protein